MGGNATLASYGVPDAGWASAAASHDAFAAAFPDAHMAFLDACGLYRRVGGYLFVHAGIRPGVPLEAQARDDLIWIREPFLTSTADFGLKVVHGHTIVPAVEHHPNRIAIDTGAVRTGTCSPASCSRAPTSRWPRAGSAAEGPLPQGSGIGSWRNLWLRALRRATHSCSGARRARGVSCRRRGAIVRPLGVYAPIASTDIGILPKTEGSVCAP